MLWEINYVHQCFVCALVSKTPSENQYLLTATMLSNCTKSTIWILFLVEPLPTMLQTHNPGHSNSFSAAHRLCPQLQQLFLLDYAETTKGSRTGVWIKGTETTARRLQWTGKGPLTSASISRHTAIQLPRKHARGCGLPCPQHKLLQPFLSLFHYLQNYTPLFFSRLSYIKL